MVKAAALYVALTCLLAWPLACRPGAGAMPGDPDTDLFIWTLAWNTHALTTNPLAIFDANIYHPHPRTLAFSENLLGSTLVAAPVIWPTGDPLLALNIVALSSIVLSAIGAFVLARRVGLSVAAALICGLIFAFSPARFFRLGQIHLTTIQWIPFCLAFVHTYLKDGRRRDLRAAIALFTLQAYTSGHGAVFLTVALTCVAAYRLALGEPVALRRRSRDVGIAGVLLAAPLVLLALPYLYVQRTFGLRRSLADWQTPASSFFASPTPLHAQLFSLRSLGFETEPSAFLFPGILAIALAATALFVRRTPVGPPRNGAPPAAPTRHDRWTRWRNDHVPLYALVTLLSILLAAGPPLGLWPLVYDLPGFSFLRVPSRFMLLGVLGIAVLGATAFDRLTIRLPARWQAAATVIAGAVLVAECYTIPLPGYRPYAVDIPAADRWLATQPGPLVIAELPTDYVNERRQSTYMLHSMALWQKTVHGHSGIRTRYHHDLFEKLRGFPSHDSFAALTAAGVTHVVVHPAMYDAADWRRAVGALPAFSDRWTQVYDDGTSQVYRLAR